MASLVEHFGLSFTQAEVDFVVPDLSADLPLSIDPFLLYKSRDQSLRALHGRLLSVFNRAIARFREGDVDELDRLIDFPEVNEIGFGYSEGKIKGLGLGHYLNRLLAETLAASPALQERGVRHVEELQLVSIGVGPDRVSDIAANALKSFHVDYTQRQAQLWDIPLAPQMPLHHLLDFDDWTWGDDYADLPRNPVSGLAILLVPRRIVRLLPWINYDDYVRTDFRAFLRPSKGPRVPSRPGETRERAKELAKHQVIEVTRSKLELVDQYVGRKEREGSQAEPALGTDQEAEQREFEAGDCLMARLQALPSGHSSATENQRLVYEILNYLFEPDLTDGKMESATHLGTERRDIIYTNEAERSFLRYVRESYGSMFLLFEIKNIKTMELEHVNQVATYLGARLGMFGFIVTRNTPGENIIRKTYSVFNDTPSMPRKTILIITDDDLITMIRLKQEGKAPVQQLKGIYQRFQWGLQ
jgi:hypothetical protein